MNWLNGKGTYIGGILLMIHGLSTIGLEIKQGKFPDQVSIGEVLAGWTAIRLRRAI